MAKVRQRTLLKSAAKRWQPWVEIPITEEMREKHPHLRHCASIFRNHRCEMQCFPVSSSIGGVMQVTIVRHMDLESLEWEEIQAAVHDRFGPESVAVEIYPAISNEWHMKVRVRVLWVLPAGWELPFGLEKPNSWGKPA